MRMRLLVRFTFSLSTVFLQDPFYPKLYPDHYDGVVGDNGVLSADKDRSARFKDKRGKYDLQLESYR